MPSRKIVLDTNCLIASLSRRGEYYPVWKGFQAGEYVLCVTTEILEEYAEIIGNDAKTGEGKLYTVRTATTEAVSQTCTDATFTVTVKEATGIGEVRKDGTAQNAYDLSGRRVLHPSKGIQIVGNKKVVTK